MIGAVWIYGLLFVNVLVLVLLVYYKLTGGIG